MKLSKLLNVFNPKDLAVDESTLEHDFAILRNYTPNLFPVAANNAPAADLKIAQDVNDYLIANFDFNKIHSSNVLDEDLLMLHTRDNVWLAKYLAKKLKTDIKNEIKNDKKNQKDLARINKEVKSKFPGSNFNFQDDNKLIVLANPKHTNIKLGNIKRFVETNKEFNAARDAYEIDLTRAQISYMMGHNQPNDILRNHRYELNDVHSSSVTYHPRFSRFQEDVDKNFYQSVVAGMKRIGIPTHSSEVALEKYAYLWRSELMQDAFYNQFMFEPSEINSNDWFVATVCDNLKTLWLRQREYQYYQDHKAIIDELGTATPNMLISALQEKSLNEKVSSLRERYEMVAHAVKKPNPSIEATRI